MVQLLEPKKVVPPLESGDRLTVAEFRARYACHPEIKKAELIDGVVYVASPTTLDHGASDNIINGLVAVYHMMTFGVQGCTNTTSRLDVGDNEPQPDVFLRILPEFGGQSRNEDKWLAGAPEFIAEVAASSASYDLSSKKDAYERNGVQEYLVWQVYEKVIDAFVLQDGKYMSAPRSPEGWFKSRCFPGLWLDLPAIAAEKFPQALQTLNQGLASPEHQAFVELLRSRYAEPN